MFYVDSVHRCFESLHVEVCDGMTQMEIERLILCSFLLINI
jgi:hypothetical protein